MQLLNSRFDVLPNELIETICNELSINSLRNYTAAYENNLVAVNVLKKKCEEKIKRNSSKDLAETILRDSLDYAEINGSSNIWLEITDLYKADLLYLFSFHRSVAKLCNNNKLIQGVYIDFSITGNLVAFSYFSAGKRYGPNRLSIFQTLKILTLLAYNNVNMFINKQ